MHLYGLLYLDLHFYGQLPSTSTMLSSLASFCIVRASTKCYSKASTSSDSSMKIGSTVATPLWAKCEDETHTPKKWELGVFRDSRNFRAQQQRAKHLAMKCSLYRWKGLEVQMSTMASHEPFGHLQPKLWAKEGLGVESTSFRRLQKECDQALESS